MEISQLLATPGSSPALQSAKGAAGDGADFAQLLSQAGNTAATVSGKAAPGLAQGASAAKTVSLEAGSHDGGEPSLEALLAELDPSERQALAEALAAGTSAHEAGATELPGAGALAQLTPLAQHIAQVLEGAVLTGQNVAPQALGQSGDGDALDLGAIRQRMDLIASAQRGDTSIATRSVMAAADGQLPGAGQTPSDATRSAVAELATRQDAGLRHQQLTAQGLQSLAQQGTTQTNGNQPGNFADAVAAITRGDAPLPTRGGLENVGGQPLASAAAHAGGTASPVGGQTAGAPVQTLSAPLASAQWQQGLGQQLISLHQRGGQQVELHLRPAELGPLTISLKVDDQLAQAQFFSANPQVRAAVEQAIPQLREALGENGIQLGEAMVGEHQQRDGGNAQTRGEAALAAGRGDIADSVDSGDDPATGSTSRTINLDGSGVDLYA